MAAAPPIDTPVRLDTFLLGSPRRAWETLAIAGGVVAGGALIAGLHYTPVVRLPFGVRILGTTGIAVLALSASASALVGTRFRRTGLVGLAGTSAATAAYWLLLGRHSLSGPVILVFSDDHGLHIGDLLAVLPLGASAYLLRTALRGATRRSRT